MDRPSKCTDPQVPATIPYAQNFDSGAHGLLLSNGAQANKWTVGPAVSKSPINSLYITNDNGATNGYNISQVSAVHAYKDIVIPATANEITVSLDYKNMGEVNWDCVKVWMVPVTFQPVPGTPITATAIGAGNRIQLGPNLQITPNWKSASFDTPVAIYQNQTRRLIFEWRNDGATGTQPAGAIDNISIKVTTCSQPTNLTAINITNTNATLDWSNPGTATGWEVAFMPATGAAIPTIPGISVTASEYTPPAGTFVFGTQYVYYVRSNCGTINEMSSWAGPHLFSLKPLNDDCSTATVTPVNPGIACINTVTGTITGATLSSQASTCTTGLDDDIWFEFVATSTKHIISISNITGSTTDLFHAVYSGPDCATMTQLYCSDPNTSIANNLVVGQTYKIRLWTNSTVAGQTTTFQLCITTVPPVPANDNCSNAITIPVNPTLTCDNIVPGTVYSATASSQVNTCQGTADDDVWYKFVATNTTHRIRLENVSGSTMTLTHVIYSGTDCATLTQLYCSVPNETWANNLTIGQTYYIRVYSWTATPGQTTSFTICVSAPPPPPVNDECSGAISIPVNPTMVCENIVNGTILSATASPQSNTCGNTADDDDVWYQFTATSTAHAIEFKNITGNTTDIYHAVYSGNVCGTLIQLYCSDPNYSIAQNLTVGETYKIRVWTNTTAINQTTAFQICVSSLPLPPVNDECANAIVVPVNEDSDCKFAVTSGIYGATASTEPNACGTTGSADDDVWFQFTATSTKHLIWLSNIIGSTTDLYHALYAGNQCGALTQMYCSDGNTSEANGLIIGNEYKLRVYSNSPLIQTTQFDVCVRTPNTPITVSTDQHTIEQLVNDVLINSECALVSNISSVSGANFADVPSIGYFDSNGATFPFSYGVVLSTGAAQLAQGPFVFGSNTGGNSTLWPGDAELNQLIVQNDPAQNGITRNATLLEFDFIPLTNKFKFDFLFTSTEYGNYQCLYSDAFAFILTDQDGNKKNLAVIPNTTIPVSVTNIRDTQYKPDCGSAHPEYFGQYNVEAPFASAINFNGQTKPMTAESTVIPGQTYHIKLVISDYLDASYASAVFLGGGSFDIGELDMGGNLTVENGTALCNAQSKTLNTGLVGNQYIFKWYKNGVVIPGATASTYEVTESGTYGVEATMQNISCSYEGSVIVEIFPLVNEMTANPAALTQCDASGFHSFDLNSNVDVLLSLPTDPENFAVSIHLTEQDAIDGINAIYPATYAAFTNTVEDLQTLWTRTVYSVTGCFGIKPFDLVVQDLTPVYTIDPDFSICDGTSDTIDVVITDTDPNPVTYTWTKDGAPLADTTPSITVTETGAYTVVLDRMGCTATSTVNVVVTPIPVADVIADTTVCESYVLPALSANNTYYDAATNTAVAAGTEITQTTSFNIVASSGTTPECTSQSTFTVTVNHAPAIPVMDNVTACDSYLLPALTVGNYYTAAGAAGDQLQEGDEIFASQTIFVYAQTGTVPNCTSEISFEVIINTSPTADAPQDVDACDSYALPALSAGNSYWTGTNATGEQLPVGYLVEQSMDIFVFAQTATNPVCTDENMFRVNITPTPSFDLGGPYRACLPSNVTITVTANNYNENEASYQWKTINGDPVAGGRIFTPTYFGTYTLTVTVKNCSHTESIEVFENTDPIALIITDGCEDGVYMVEVSDENGSFDTGTTNYAWTGPGNFTSDKRSFATNVEGEYYVTITTAEGCTSEDSYIVTSTSCEIQKGISPNNDGYNDYFDLSELMVRHLGIFNRYGQEVYSKDNYKNEWTGQTNNGKELPTGTYFYMIEFTSGESKTGWIYINRQD